MKRNSTQDAAPRSSRGRPATEDLEARGDRRSSPDAVEKRRAARRFNDLLLGGGRPSDGRTERRRRRLLEELADGVARRGRRALKPIDVLSRVDELLALGEPIASIREACPPPRPVEGTPELVDGVRRIHRAYRFAADAYRFVGVDDRALRDAGVIPARGQKQKQKKKKDEEISGGGDKERGGRAGEGGGERVAAAKPGLARRGGRSDRARDGGEARARRGAA